MKDEVFRVMIPYQAVFVRAKHRNPETGFFRAEVPVAMRSVGADEAPVVCEIDARDSTRTGADNLFTWTETLRSFEGRLFKAKLGHASVPVTLDTFRADTVHDPDRDGHLQWMANPFIAIASPGFSKSNHSNRLKNLQKIEEVAMRSIAENDFAESEARVARSLDGFLFVDGVLHVPCREPVIRIQHGKARTRVFFSVAGDGKDSPDDIAFRVDRLAEASAFARRSRGMLDVKDAPIEEFVEVRMHRPEALGRDDLAEHAAQFAARATEEAHSALPWIDRAGLMAYADLRDAAARLLAAPDRAAATAFLEIYATVAAAAEEAQAAGADTPGLHFFLQAARVHLMRWRDFEGGPKEALKPEDEAALGLMMDGSPR